MLGKIGIQIDDPQRRIFRGAFRVGIGDAVSKLRKRTLDEKNQ